MAAREWTLYVCPDKDCDYYETALDAEGWTNPRCSLLRHKDDDPPILVPVAVRETAPSNPTPGGDE